MKLKIQTKNEIKNNIEFILSQKESGVPEDGIVCMLKNWICGLLEYQCEDWFENK
jgi:hypothetical protein